MGVVVSQNEVLHLCVEVGQPTVWSFEEFAKRPHYSHLVGYKRPL